MMCTLDNPAPAPRRLSRWSPLVIPFAFLLAMELPGQSALHSLPPNDLRYIPLPGSHAAGIAGDSGSALAAAHGPDASAQPLPDGPRAEKQADVDSGRGKTVLLDAWYNSQKRKNSVGQEVLFHYKWDDSSNSGFSLFGEIFRSFGVETKTLSAAPTVDSLKDAQLYIIVSPDNASKNPAPHYMTERDAEQIAGWVKRGGVLLMMENDRDNADITHFDILADRFGLHFNNVLTHHVIGDQFEMGRIDVKSPAAPFTSPHILYMKDTCSLSLSHGATSLLQWKGDTLMAFTHYGKGTVVAVADPWLYNEYTDGKKLPPEYDNRAAGREFVEWLLKQR